MLAHVRGLPVGVGIEAVALYFAEGFGAALGDVVAAVEGDEAASLGDEVDHALEGGLHGREVGVDVGVVELDVSEDGDVGKVVEELGPLVEEGGVVLVAFEDEGARALVDAEAGAEVFGDASDEEGRREREMGAAGDFVDPGEHAGGGGLAVGSADDETLAVGEEFVVDEGGHGGHGDAGVEYEFEFGVAARDGVADDDEVGTRVEVGGAEGLHDGDAQLAELVGHGWVRGGVGAGDVVSLGAQHAGEGGHRGAADADEVDVLCAHFVCSLSVA